MTKLACIDAHIHLDMYEERRLVSLLADAKQSGVEAVVAVAMHLASCKATRELASRHTPYIIPAYGYHPEQPVLGKLEADKLFDWLQQRYAAGEQFAIGEVGLPYYLRTEKAEAGELFDQQPYVDLLERFVELAAKWNRPIVLHAVYEDAVKACELLEKHRVLKAHFHWFKGDRAVVRRMAQAGYYISVTPDVQYEEEIKELVRQYPLELIMVETDGPWPFEGRYEGRETVPAMALDAAVCIAELKGLPAEQTAAALLANTKRFYSI